VPAEVFARAPVELQEKARRLERQLAEAVERDAQAQAAVPRVREKDRLDLQAAVHAGAKQMPESRLPGAEAEAGRARETLLATRAAVVENAQVVLASLPEADLGAALEDAEEQKGRALEEAAELGKRFRPALQESARARHAAGWIRQLLERGVAPPFEASSAALPTRLRNASQSVRMALEDVEAEQAGERWKGLAEVPAVPGTIDQPGNPNRGPRDRGEPQPRRGFRMSPPDPLGRRGGAA
jgi:hypothetical protein